MGKHFKPEQDSGSNDDYPADEEGMPEFPWGNKLQKSRPQQDDASQQPDAEADTGAPSDKSSGGDDVSDAGEDCWGDLLPGQRCVSMLAAAAVQSACSKPILRRQVGQLGACTRRATLLKLLECCDCLLQS